MAERVAAVARRLDAREWPARTGRLRLLGFDVDLCCSDPGAATLAARLWAPLAVPGTAVHRMTLTSIEGAERPTYAVDLDGVRLVETPSASIAFAHCCYEANQQAIACTPGRVLVHAGAVATPDGAVLVTGPMGAGKSTLVAGLVQRGLGYLTDEIGAIDPATGHVAPYPKFLSLGRAGQEPFPELAPSWSAGERRYLGTSRLVPVAELGDVVTSPQPIRAVVSVRYEPGSPATIERQRGAAALLALAEQTFSLERDPRALETLAAVLQDADCYALEGDDLDTMCRLVQDRLGVEAIP